MATATSSVADICRAAKRAAATLARTQTETKDAALLAIAQALQSRSEQILLANEADMTAGEQDGMDAALLDRLRLDEARISAIAGAVRQIAALPDPVGEVVEGKRLPNGLDVRKVRVPLGVVAVVYEARPNVTIDAAALCLKAGNAIVLRGSSAAQHSNAALAQLAAEAVVASGLPEGAVSLLRGGDRAELGELATQRESVDLIIPRGGESLKEALQLLATVPVIYAASGNCHVYVDAAADLEQAEAIAINAKVQRPGVCNAAETLLVHRDVAAEFIPRLLPGLAACGVLVRGDARTLSLASGGEGGRDALAPAGELLLESAQQSDWATEYLDLVLAVRVVDSLAEAIEHIGRYGSGHSEAIVTRDRDAARAFQLGVDAACVYVNASTRFTDGGEFGMGAEIGNSTQKLHARGPIGLRELCTTKYLVEGDGQIRG
ncbi:MAG: glutamate-5-semialdehyde dehydrogenase [Actinobacteria bacterium]|nr:MAG: glutamate-5-semialdehyde dehydrogenase [Actinomycetota bacterium]